MISGFDGDGLSYRVAMSEHVPKMPTQCKVTSESTDQHTPSVAHNNQRLPDRVFVF